MFTEGIDCIADMADGIVVDGVESLVIILAIGVMALLLTKG